MKNPFITALEAILDRKYIITSPSKTLRYRKGYRSGQGDALAVVKPGSLTELWQVLKAAVKFDIIIIMQASNTSLTEGSTPAGSYEREVIIVSLTRIKSFHLINQGKQVLAYPGTTLYTLENALKPLGREPHSVIGSSCLGASVIGGICNSSGGSLVKRGPAYTELSLYARIDENGELQLVNHLGIDLGDTPEQILANLDAGHFDPDAIPESTKHAHDHTYQTRVRDIDADSPARYNAAPNQLYESSGSSGKVAVFAVRLDTFLKEQNEKIFYIGTNTPDVLETMRRKILTEFDNLPVAGEYMHREIYDIAKKYGKDSYIVIDKLGTNFLPYLFAMKANAERILDKMKIFKPYLPDRILQKLSHLFPNHLPKRMEEYREKYEHHLMLKMSDTGSLEAEEYLTELFQEAEGDFFVCTPEEGSAAFLHRFVAAGAAIRFQEVHQDEFDDILALDIALRRNEMDWFEKLPEEISSQIEHKLYYGHFFCHVLHQDYILKKGVDSHALEKQLLDILDARGAIYPAEHNVGHLYQAAPSLVDHYKKGDPTNSFNPGIGKTSKRKHWV